MTPFLVPSVLGQNLREANARLRFWLDGLIPDHGRSAGGTPEQINGLLAELRQAGEWLRTMPQNKDSDLEREFAEYRKNVERLRDLLPYIHETLLLQRSRLKSDRARLDSLAQWAQASRQTI